MADGGWSNAQESAILEWYFANGTSVARTSTWVALCLAAPADDSNVISEPTYTDVLYQRQEITNAQWEYSPGTVDPTAFQNTVAIQFPLCNQNVAETVTHWALMSLASGGELIFSGSIAVPSGGLVLNAGVQPQFDISALRVQLGS